MHLFVCFCCFENHTYFFKHALAPVPSMLLFAFYQRVLDLHLLGVFDSPLSGVINHLIVDSYHGDSASRSA